MNLINKIFRDGINTYIDKNDIYSKIKENDLLKVILIMKIILNLYLREVILWPL